MTIDITPESVENLWRFWANKAQVLADENKALSAALTASQAETAAAYDAAAQVYIDGDWPWHSDADDAIRAITPADSKAALDRMIAEARADGMREAAGIVDSKYASGEMGNPGHHIIAAIPKGNDHE